MCSPFFFATFVRNIFRCDKYSAIYVREACSDYIGFHVTVCCMIWYEMGMFQQMFVNILNLRFNENTSSYSRLLSHVRFHMLKLMGAFLQLFAETSLKKKSKKCEFQRVFPNLVFSTNISKIRYLRFLLP